VLCQLFEDEWGSSGRKRKRRRFKGSIAYACGSDSGPPPVGTVMAERVECSKEVPDADARLDASESGNVPRLSLSLDG